MTKRGAWAACSLVALVPVGVGAALHRVYGTFVGAALGTAYLVGTFHERAPLFGRVARTRRDEQAFALTFDDGPDPRYTRQLGRLLAERGHRATFFVLGDRAERHPDILRELVADGHELASHGYDHSLLALAPPAVVRDQLAATERAVEAATGAPPIPLLRTPHGARSPWLHRAAGKYRVCAWDGRVFDTATPGVETIVERVTKLLRPGAVVLLHDGDGSGRQGDRSQTVAALPAILDEAERRGLRSESLSRLLA